MTETSPPALPVEPIPFTCPACGANTAYAPGTSTMKCPSCGAVQQIEVTDHTIVEHSYDDWAKIGPKPVATIGKVTLRCQGCGATTETDDIAGTCQFCGGVLVAQQNPEGLIAPEAVVPFGLDKSKARDAFATWVKSRWFAPSALKKVGSTEAMKGTYVPHWTYDAQTDTQYTGERGEHYYTTESYTVSDGKGGTRTETRQVQHTAWYPASGAVSRFFDDVLVQGSNVLPHDKLEKMGPWTLESAQAYQPQFVAGYSALRYDVDPDSGLADARGQMEKTIRQDCKHDIGGDEQRVSSMNVNYTALMFKLMLLPIWIASYLYAGKSFQVLVNANTGEVIGERPYSKLKIFLAVLAAIVLIAAIIVIIVVSKSHSGGSS